MLCLDQFDLHILDIIIIEVKTPFECTVRHTPLAFQQGDNLCKDVVKRHNRSSSNTSNNAFASFKSAVSKPSVNQLYTGARRSWASWRFSCCCQRRARLVAARSSSDLACW